MQLSSGLWRPAAKDIASVIAPIQYLRQGTTSGGALNSISPVSWGRDYVLQLYSLHVLATPNAGRIATLIQVQIFDEAGTVIADLASAGPGAIGTVVHLHWAGNPIHVFSDQELRSTVNFDAAAAGNTQAFSLQGMLYPRGNWQRN